MQNKTINNPNNDILLLEKFQTNEANLKEVFDVVYLHHYKKKCLKACSMKSNSKISDNN